MLFVIIFQGYRDAPDRHYVHESGPRHYDNGYPKGMHQRYSPEYYRYSSAGSWPLYPKVRKTQSTFIDGTQNFNFNSTIMLYICHKWIRLCFYFDNFLCTCSLFLKADPKLDKINM